MKLFTKYNRVNLLATIVIFLFASTAFYLVLHYILLRQVDEDLRIEQREIETFVQEHNTLPEPVPVKDQKITYTPTNQFLTGRKFSTAFLEDSFEKEKDYQRVLSFDIKADNKIYAVTVAKSLERTDRLIKSILVIALITILTILLVSLFINRILLKNLWKPFYGTLDTIKNFRVDKKQTAHFPATKIDEFAFMNNTLEKATNLAKKDYLSLKEFTENASHEM